MMGSPAYRMAITTSPSKGSFNVSKSTAAGELGNVDVFSEGRHSERSAKNESLDELHCVCLD